MAKNSVPMTEQTLHKELFPSCRRTILA
ncbi:hypothetical protein GCK32_020271 [Trichostrongylus colubriformis]|uniref:Uncharacterized protein n=1 Tax=Trichostrongylus colubriformis TaxID=6319 RepID=A0AAN8FS34_TRICO